MAAELRASHPDIIGDSKAVKSGTNPTGKGSAIRRKERILTDISNKLNTGHLFTKPNTVGPREGTVSVEGA